MPKININGVCREMSQTEIAELMNLRANAPAPEKSKEERLASAENVADMAYINSELALAILQETEG